MQWPDGLAILACVIRVLEDVDSWYDRLNTREDLAPIAEREY
jgi:hypothetical protein